MCFGAAGPPDSMTATSPSNSVLCDTWWAEMAPNAMLMFRFTKNFASFLACLGHCASSPCKTIHAAQHQLPRCDSPVSGPAMDQDFNGFQTSHASSKFPLDSPAAFLLDLPTNHALPGKKSLS